jgi:hypothetical protein
MLLLFHVFSIPGLVKDVHRCVLGGDLYWWRGVRLMVARHQATRRHAGFTLRRRKVIRKAVVG